MSIMDGSGIPSTVATMYITLYVGEETGQSHDRLMDIRVTWVENEAM